MDFAKQRREMVDRQLRPRGITDPRVLEAMRTVPREEFLPPALRDAAYLDRAQPIDRQQTISQPYTVAFMCQALQLAPDDVVLEIGAGSGYGAAVLSRLARRVHTIERIAELADRAAQTLQKLGFDNVTVHVGDGIRGLPELAPFDAICVTAGGTDLPEAYVSQLSPGGRILIPLASAPGAQTMYRFTRRGSHLEREPLGMFAFVPLLPGVAEPEGVD